MPTDLPREIGPFRVLGVLGEGGVGTVYLVQQQEPVRRKAALKLIKLGMDTREVLVRFAQERQLLASMSHPGIAKLFDAGRTADGRPYFVMEYVAGEPITDHCDSHRLGVPERLALFVAACRAVDHAHRRGILHRDLKPTNLLVASQDGSPVPMVIDFGLAKVLRTEPASAHLLTRDGQFLGTPSYMSPEQIELPSDQIDVRSDVYALGVVLFELLVGEPPHARRITDGGLASLLRSVRAEESVRPSTLLARAGADVAAIAERRRADRSALLAQLRGDLDWIVVKALERDRERRYASAAELADDVERHLRGEPVTARPPSFVYRFERLVRRNPVPVAALLAVVLAMVVSSVASTVWYLRAFAARAPRTALADLTRDVHRDVADAHLSFEEAINDDATRDLQEEVLAPLSACIADVERVLAGDPPTPASAAARSAGVEPELERLAADLVSLRDLAGRRWSARTGAGRIGGPLDQEFDELDRAIETRCRDLGRALEEGAEAEWARAARAAMALNTVALVGLAVAALLARRFWRARA